MNHFLKAFLAFSLLLTACQERVPETIAEPTTPANEKELLVQLKTLIDITYDQPDACTYNPDSLISSVKTLPVSKEGKTLYELLLINIGFCLKDKGYVLKSITYFEKAFTYYQQQSPAEIDFYNYIAKPLGNLYTRTGDFEKAVLLQQSAINIAVKEKRVDMLSSLYNNIAITFLQTKQHHLVAEACAKGLSLIKKTNTTSAQLYNTLAQSFEVTGKTDSALFYNKSALKVFDQKYFQGDTVIWQLSALELQSILAQDRQDFNTANHSINKAIAIAEKIFPDTKSREKAKLYEVRGNLFVKQHQWGKARADFEKVFNLFGLRNNRYSFPDNTITDAIVGLARCYVHVLPDSASAFYMRAVENDYLVQQFIVNKQSNYFNSSGNRKVLNEAMAFMKIAYDQKTDKKKETLIADMLWITELSKGRQLLMEIDRTRHWQEGNKDSTFRQAMAQLRYLHEEIATVQDSVKLQQLKLQVQEIELKFQLSEKYSQKYFSIPDKASFLQYLNKQTINHDFVSWLITEGDSSYVFLKTENVLLVRLLPTQTILPQAGGFVERYFKKGPDNYNNDPQAYKASSEAILLQLIPDADLLKKKNLILSPDGFVYSVPFDALCHKGNFWVTGKNIIYTYTFLLNQGSEQQPVSNADITVFMKSHHEKGLADLPFAEEESEIINDNFKSAVYANAKADDQTFINAMNTPAVIHVATHAIADETGQYLVLDKKLTLDKIQYTTTRSPLVVLSACYTASGKLITAEGVEGLNKAFLSKGVKGVIASQWPVDDATMPQIIGLFYNQLAQSHHAALALAAAKRVYLNNSPVVLHNPWYWASLSYTGSDVEIIIERKNRWVSYPAALVVAGVVAIFFIVIKRKINRG